MKRIGVLTSGGDAPGMNAAIRAVTRTALYNGLEVVGIRRGYEGLLEGDLVPMTRSSVGGILLHGGTILRTARCPEFMRPEGVNAGVSKLKENDIDALVIIGGDGSFRGAHELHERGVITVGIPATIDNDMAGTDCTIGFDTACNTALECISKLRDTASSHDRMFIVEVMGRNAGFLALETGVACGAEFVLVPEIAPDLDAISKKLSYAKARGKTHSLIVLAEGVMSASELAEKLRGQGNYDPRIVVLGHLQRGGAPSCFDTVLASRLGAAAVELLLKGERGRMVGRINGNIVSSEIRIAWESKRDLDPDMIRLVETLSI
ncbi:MAG TPA: 6-phosphofructokinase [Synergistaceae bacterium]|nr:6-phosphofructokinase [Synergistaceae bacterium]NLL41030.1 6-phosphofructokinase [Synergistaceae bacterium]HPX03704.1 6-phosphofructokinase [Synergistaceae bacterium]HQA54602.1 6-phosphofructokinase [Synergistaceae bacterium]